MPAFRFEAINAIGKTEKGVLNADNARGVRTQLRMQNLTPLVVEPAATSLGGEQRQQGFRLLSRRRLTQQEQAILTRQMASLLSAGLPLDEALTVLIEQSERDYIRELMAAIRAQVLAGRSLANALVQYPRDFPDIYRALVASGEHTGKLEFVLSRLADYIDQRNTLKQKILLAFTYPAIVTTIALSIVTFLLSYVVPQVVHVFENTKQQLPMLTILIMTLSSFIRHWWWVILISILILGYIGRLILVQPGQRLDFDRWLLTTSVGKFVRGYNTVRFASTLGILSAAGVPILHALQAASETLSNRAMRSNIEEVIARVREGSSLSCALGQHTKMFSPVLVHFIRSGEATGNVAAMLNRAAEDEVRELERRTMFLTSLLEPLLILVMGGVVLVIVLAVMLPIIELNNLVQ